MLTVEHFKKVVKWDVESTRESTLYIWGNDEVDTAVLAQIIRSGEWSKLDYVEGCFAAFYETLDKIYLLCDRLGIYPLFYYANEYAVYASPRIPDILKTIEHPLPHSINGILSLLLFGHHIADETIFEGIKRCNGGETIVISSKGDREERIQWKSKHIYQSKSSMAPATLAELFVQNVKRSLPVDGKVLISLSGGFDSRAVLGAVLECMEPERLHTLTFGGTDTYDFRIAKLVANKIGVKNTAFAITDQMFSDNYLSRRAGDYSYSYPALSTQPQEMITYLSRELSEGKIALWGVGGDAITGSHLRPSDISLGIFDDSKDFARLLVSKRCYLPVKVVSEITNLDKDEIITIISQLIEKCSLKQYDIPWQFLDAWDIFVRGRMEIIAVLPFYEQSWRCPHLGRDYFNAMSTQCFEEKIRQNMYKRILSSRFKSLFSLPSRRLRGRSLVRGQWQSLYWVMCWRANKVRKSLGKIIGQSIDEIGRNYGKEQKFFNSIQGRDNLHHSIDILSQQGILRRGLNDIFEITRRNKRLGRILLTLGYAFDK